MKEHTVSLFSLYSLLFIFYPFIYSMCTKTDFQSVHQTIRKRCSKIKSEIQGRSRGRVWRKENGGRRRQSRLFTYYATIATISSGEDTRGRRRGCTVMDVGVLKIIRWTAVTFRVRIPIPEQCHP
jgi:hypothetical protein